MIPSWEKFCHCYTEQAIWAVRLAVSALRARGIKSADALRDVAPDLGISERRARSLFYREEGRIVLADEWHALRVRAAALCRREANRLRLRAEQLDAQADALEGAHPSLWGENEWRGGYDSEQRRAA